MSNQRNICPWILHIYICIHIYIYVPRGTAMRRCRLNECRIYSYIHINTICTYIHINTICTYIHMNTICKVSAIHAAECRIYVYKRDDILQKRPIMLRSLLIPATSYEYPMSSQRNTCRCVELYCADYICHWILHVAVLCSLHIYATCGIQLLNACMWLYCADYEYMPHAAFIHIVSVV